MITINGKKFAESENEFIDSLFSPDGTCVGFAKRMKRSIYIEDHQHNRVGVINQELVLGSATPQGSKYWYSYATPKIISNDSFARPDISHLPTGRDRKGYIFN